MDAEYIKIATSYGRTNLSYYLLPKTELTLDRKKIEQFILELTDSTTINEAHKKIEAVIGYSVSLEHISPLLKNEKDAEKVIKYFARYEDLFD